MMIFSLFLFVAALIVGWFTWIVFVQLDNEHEQALKAIATMQLQRERRIREEHPGHNCRLQGHISYRSGLRSWNGEHELRCGVCGDHIGASNSLS